MKTIRSLERLQQLHKLIECETTGSPKELARTMEISERLVYHIIDQLKDYEAPIAYDRSRKTYYYTDDFDLDVNISITVVSNKEKSLIFGGAVSPLHFIQY